MNIKKMAVIMLVVIIASILMGIIYLRSKDQWLSPRVRQQVKQIKELEDVVEFYGKIVDQYGQPVVKAVIIVDVIQFSYEGTLPIEIQLTSNESGLFAVEPGKNSVKGCSMFIRDIKKQGYAIRYDQGKEGDRSADYMKDNPNRFKADKNNPVIFHMRKKWEYPAFLFEEPYLELEVRADEFGITRGYDFIQQERIKNLSNPEGESGILVCDLQVAATFNTNSSKWQVVLSPGGTNGGIIVSDQLLYEAPQDGYQSEYTFTPEDRQPVKSKYIYLRSRNLPIYSRLELDDFNANEEFFRLNGRSVTNPYGERNLEQATDLPYEVIKKLTDEARAALRSNTYPAKADLPELIKAAKKKKATRLFR